MPPRISLPTFGPPSLGWCAAAQVDLGSARDALDEALALPQRFVTPTGGHVRRAFALRDRIRVVDGLYVALADELDCPLVTTDHRLAAADAPCEIRTPPAQPGHPTGVITLPAPII